jgi:hypothetical protein
VGAGRWAFRFRIGSRFVRRTVRGAVVAGDDQLGVGDVDRDRLAGVYPADTCRATMTTPGVGHAPLPPAPDLARRHPHQCQSRLLDLVLPGNDTRDM